MSGYDNTPRAWVLRDQMVADYVAKFAGAESLEEADRLAGGALSLIGLAAEAGQAERAARWARGLGSAHHAATNRLLGLGRIP